MLHIAYSPIYQYQLPEGHRFPMLKYELIPEQLIYEGTIKESQFFRPDKLTRDEMLLTHTSEFLDKLDNQTLSPKEIRQIGFPMTSQLVERGKHISKGTYLCALHALENGIAINVAGGTHHAFADHGEGFCVYNDFSIASNLLLRENKVKQILIVDLDVHQGNGTAKIFENNSNVFTFSMHGAKNYPGRKETSDLDIGLPDGSDDQLFLQTLEANLPRLIDEVQPDFIFYLAGADVLASDKLGRLGVTVEGARKRDAYVLSRSQKHNIPVAISMGGGYSEDIKVIIEAHANTFRTAQELFF